MIKRFWSFGVSDPPCQIPRSKLSVLILCPFDFLLQELNEFWGVYLLLEAMVKKLSYTASLELVPLMEVPGVKQASATLMGKTLVFNES